MTFKYVSLNRGSGGRSISLEFSPAFVDSWCSQHSLGEVLPSQSQRPGPLGWVYPSRSWLLTLHVLPVTRLASEKAGV